MNSVNAAIAANRTGLGATPGELDRIKRVQPWLLDQLQGPSRPPAALQKLPYSASVLVEAQALRKAQREARRDNEDNDMKYGRWARGHYVGQAEARYRHAAMTDLPFHDRLMHFWSNHFAVSADKQPLPTVAGLMENEAIRPHVSGRFYDVLLAVEAHPAMILYLDNQRSIGPNSAMAARARQRRRYQKIGLNENLAREILELHTLGVDGGYTQDDVTCFAKVITGWSIGGAGGAVNGGRVITDWPGLADSDLYEGRDLQPTTDLRSIFKGVLAEHLDIAPAFVDREVFPDSTGARRIENPIRT